LTLNGTTGPQLTYLGLDDTREIMPLNEAQIRQECAVLRSKGIKDVAIIGVFSPLDIKGAQEHVVREIVLQEIPDADVVLSRDSKYPRTQIQACFPHRP